MKKTIINLLASASILFALGAMALTGSIDIWSDLDDERFSYVDKNYPLGKMVIKAKKKSNSMLDLQIILNKKIGSRTRKKYYVAHTKQDADLPMEVELKKSNRSGRPIGSRTEGSFLIKEANRQVISGTIFNKEVEAEAYQVE